MEILTVSAGLMPRRAGLWQDGGMSVEEAREAVRVQIGLGDQVAAINPGLFDRLLDDLIRAVKAEMPCYEQCRCGAHDAEETCGECPSCAARAEKVKV